MIRDVEKWEAWEREYERNQPVDVVENIWIFHALYRQAVSLGVLPTKDPLEGIEEKIEFARRLNLLGPPNEDSQGA